MQSYEMNSQFHNGQQQICGRNQTEQTIPPPNDTRETKRENGPPKPFEPKETPIYNIRNEEKTGARD